MLSFITVASQFSLFRCCRVQKNAPDRPIFCQGRIHAYPRYHLACLFPDRLITVLSHRMPHNAGNASADTQVSPFPLPSAVHLLPRFSPRFHHRGLSADALRSFISASTVFRIVDIKLHLYPLVKNFFPWVADTAAPAAPLRKGMLLRIIFSDRAFSCWFDPADNLH